MLELGKVTVTLSADALAAQQTRKCNNRDASFNFMIARLEL
jgi:hypothetical protein